MDQGDTLASLLAPVHAGPNPQILGLGIALCLGLLVGLQREWADDKPMGVRTMALAALFGGLCALFARDGGVWVIAAGLLSLSLLLGLWLRSLELKGLTTVMTAPVVFLLGATATSGYWITAVVFTGAVTLLLQWKEPLHRWVDRLAKEDLQIIARFVLITLVILPILPNQDFGPYEVFNPFKTWLLVVLIVGINLIGYLAFRLVGAGAGGWLAGVLGGLISSTATTVSYANLSRQKDTLGPLAALVVLIASTIVYPRVLVELSVVSPELVGAMAAPAAVFSVVLVGMAGLIHWRAHTQFATELPPRDNPAGLRMAVSFGALYVFLLLAVSAARDYVGEGALFGVAALSGLMDVDALTLSVGQLHAKGEASTDIAWRAIFIASLSNLAFKTGAAALLGSPSLRRWILRTGLTALALGAGLVALWP